jgi:hypothetical protein
MGDALLQYGGSGRRSFEKRKLATPDAKGTVQAAFKKLARLPVAVSQAFLSECTAALREIFPRARERKLPESLRAFRPCIWDGKALKRVAKRLKPLRGLTAGMVGGRALVVMDWLTGLASCLQADADGEANEVRCVAELAPVVRQHIAGPRLHVVDRAFCDLQQPQRFTEAGDHFLVRYHVKVAFAKDAGRPERNGVDEDGRPFTEQWGWLGSERNKQRRYVRRLDLQRTDKEAIVLITDLLDAEQYPAADLLWLYRERVGIEYLFQEVTEVFGLRKLITSNPQGCIFQFAYCLLLYNMIQVVRAYVAEGQEREVDKISAEKLFDDVRRELIAWQIMLDVPTTLHYFAKEPTLNDVVPRLSELLGSSWCPTWQKASPQRGRKKSPAKKTRSHGSVHRILQAHRQAKQTPRGP